MGATSPTRRDSAVPLYCQRFDQDTLGVLEHEAISARTT